jgi:hypothetical protein
MANQRSAVGRFLSFGVAAVVAGGSAHAVDRSWNAAQGNWSVAANWFPVGVPGPGDAVFLGNLPIAMNDWVTLTANVTVAELTVTDGMVVDTNLRKLVVNGPVLVSGENEGGGFVYSSRINLDNGAAAFDAETGPIALEQGGVLRLRDGATIEVNGNLDVDVDSRVSGTGTVRLMGGGARSLVLNGVLDTDAAPLTLLQLGAGLIDLDGDVAGDSILNVTTSAIDGSAAASLIVDGVALADPFDDDLWLSDGNLLDMDLDQGWATGVSSEIRVFGGSPGAGPSVIDGAPLAIGGALTVASVGGAHLRLLAATTLLPTSTVTVGEDDLLEFDATAELDEAVFEFGPGAVARFDGPTEILGATFAMSGPAIADGSVTFNGPTVWDGSISSDGFVRQNGDAEVVGPTQIEAAAFDFDGATLPNWTITSGLTITAGSLESGGASVFNGSIELSPTLASRLTVNLTGPAEAWVIAGELTLRGLGNLILTRLAGSPLTIAGATSVEGRIQATCPLTVGANATVTFETGASALRLAAASVVESGATFVGAGQVETSTAATLRLDDGASLGSAGLFGAGKLLVADGPGIAFVGAMSLAPTSTLVLELGGESAGTEHDALLATAGPMSLAGTLAVAITGDGDALFEPNLGDEFTVLLAPNGIWGSFAADPVSSVPGRTYQWDVLYEPTAVKLSLEAIVLCPADLDGDGTVSAADLTILLGSWGTCKQCVADIDQDGTVGGADLTLLLSSWGSCLN